eukprot:16906-Amphidinium_carterae.1
MSRAIRAFRHVGYDMVAEVAIIGCIMSDSDWLRPIYDCCDPTKFNLLSKRHIMATGSKGRRACKGVMAWDTCTHEQFPPLNLIKRVCITSVSLPEAAASDEASCGGLTSNASKHAVPSYSCDLEGCDT